MTESVEDLAAKDAPGSPPPGPPPGGRDPNPMGADGFPVMPKARPGRPMMFMGRGRARMQATAESMEELAKMLGNQVGKPVTDATGLTGKYDFDVTFDMERMGMGRGGLPPPSGGGVAAGSGGDSPLSADSDMGVPLAGAIQSQLGLKLESKKGQVEMIVVDHAEKVPTEN
jgi:uncharacterized protein (TIGR03435 family)